ncbi:MAG: hypothetical protein HC809_08475 [Gammaproteobacteria bacterium]|nr:hypothetical protein [Gammaproteobacteria bacterium]
MLDPVMEARFIELEVRLDELMALLDRVGERFWRRMIGRYLPEVRARRLTGVTGVLGCFGGQDTFSDLTVGYDLDARRLAALRTAIFDVANGIAADSAGSR